MLRGLIKVVPRAKSSLKYALVLVLILAVFAWIYALTPWTLGKELLVLSLDHVFAYIYRDDLSMVAAAQKSYLRGDAAVSQPAVHWKKLEKQHPGFTLISYQGAADLPEQVPFVYQRSGQTYLQEVSRKYALPELASGAGNEYQAMLQVCRWVGTRFDHGADAVPGGTVPVHPDLVLEGGAKGGKYWCEIAAKLTVEVASALGWPARLVTASKDGYHWDHAVAELWSNHFNKWFVVDTDFNLLYESDGVPLSAYELCHLAPELERQGRLKVRRIAPAKRSLQHRELLPFYRYVHIDLRNDWFTRRLRPLSPAGGDFSTWWTGRPELGQVITGKKRVDAREQFDWKLHQVQISPLGLEDGNSGSKNIRIGLRTYSPDFAWFEVQGNGARYLSRDGRVSLQLKGGVNHVAARVVDSRGNRGPLYRVSYTWGMGGSSSD